MGQDPRCEINGTSPALAMQYDFVTYMLFSHSGFYDLSCSFWHPLGIECISEFMPFSVISRGRVKITEEFIPYLEKRTEGGQC